MPRRKKIVITWLDYLRLSDEELNKKIELVIEQNNRSNKERSGLVYPNG